MQFTYIRSYMHVVRTQYMHVVHTQYIHACSPRTPPHTHYNVCFRVSIKLFPSVCTNPSSSPLSSLQLAQLPTLYILNMFTHSPCVPMSCICTCSLGNMYTRTTQDDKFASCPLLPDVVPLSTDMHIPMYTFYLFQ